MKKIALTVFVTLVVTIGSSAKAAIERNPVAIKDVAKVLALVCESKGLERFGDWAIKNKINRDKFSSADLLIDFNRLKTKSISLKVGDETITASKNQFTIGATSGSDACDALMNYIDRKSAKFSIWNFLIENAHAASSMELQKFASIAQGAATAGLLSSAVNGSENRAAVVSGLAQLADAAKHEGRTSFRNPVTDAPHVPSCGDGEMTISAGNVSVGFTKAGEKISSVSVQVAGVQQSADVNARVAKAMEHSRLPHCAGKDGAKNLSDRIKADRKDGDVIAANVLERKSGEEPKRPIQDPEAVQ